VVDPEIWKGGAEGNVSASSFYSGKVDLLKPTLREIGRGRPPSPPSPF